MSLAEIVHQIVEDVKQVLEDFLLPIYKERIRKWLKLKGEMTESDYERFAIERQDWRQKEGRLNSFSRWVWFQAFDALRKEGELKAHHHGKGHPITYSLKEA